MKSELSKCCGAKVTVEPQGKVGKYGIQPGGTYWYSCNACGKDCDLKESKDTGEGIYE